MKVILDGDVTFVTWWVAPPTHDPVLHIVPYDVLKAGTYDRGSGGFELPVPAADIEAPSEGFYKKAFAAIEKQITTPVAFACLAPKGWVGERSWFNHQAMIAHGWQNMGWKESSHKDKTWVQFYMRELDRPLPKNPKFYDEDAPHSYVGTTHKGTIPFLGCSVITSSFAKPKDDFEIPRPSGTYGGVAPEKFLHLIRQVRPGALKATARLKEGDFKLIYQSPFANYWLRAKPGVGGEKSCEY